MLAVHDDQGMICSLCNKHSADLSSKEIVVYDFPAL